MMPADVARVDNNIVKGKITEKVKLILVDTEK